jgi:hypothetical protein
LGVNASVVELKVVGHVGVLCSGPQVADFIVMGFKGSHKLGNVGAGSSKLLGGDGSLSFHCSSKPIGHYAHNLSEFVSAETDEGFG